jgi:hypothetical protein
MRCTLGSTLALAYGALERRSLKCNSVSQKPKS